MNKLFCKHCHQEVTFIIEKKSNNNVAFCTICGCFIKNVPNSFLGIKTSNHIFPFGKYKGVKISECTDINYMEWVMKNLTNMNDDFLDELYKRLNELI